VTALLAIADDYKKTILEGYKTIIAEQGRCDDVRVRRSGASFSGEFSLDRVATEMAGDVEVMVPLDDLEGSEAEQAKERDRLEKELAKVRSEEAYLTKKLANPAFTARAPLEVLEKDRARLAEVQSAMARIGAALDRLNRGAA
jgi:valyl-tRNA synthetase